MISSLPQSSSDMLYLSLSFARKLCIKVFSSISCPVSNALKMNAPITRYVEKRKDKNNSFLILSHNHPSKILTNELLFTFGKMLPRNDIQCVKGNDTFVYEVTCPQTRPKAVTTKEYINYIFKQVANEVLIYNVQILVFFSWVSMGIQHGYQIGCTSYLVITAKY